MKLVRLKELEESAWSTPTEIRESLTEDPRADVLRFIIHFIKFQNL